MIANANAADELRRAWDEARALHRPPMDRAATRAAVLRVLALASATTIEAEEVRRDAETLLLVVESGGTAAARHRAQEQWLAFARRRIRAGETVQDLAQMMHAVGIVDMRALPSVFGRAFARAWADERLTLLADQGRVDRKLRAQWRATLVPRDPAQAYRFACESLRRGHWAHAAACARVAERHKTVTTRESARIALLTALHRAGTPDVAMLRDTIASCVAATKRGRKVWMFDWRTLAALAIACDVDDRSLLASLADAWRAADPTFAATALLTSTTKKGAKKTSGERR